MTSSYLIIALISMLASRHAINAYFLPTISTRIVKQCRPNVFYTSSVPYKSFVSCTSSTIDHGDSKIPDSPPTKARIEGLELLEIRVGKIVSIARHAEADTLYVEQVDLGEPTGPRTIVSGLVQYCTEEQLLNREVIVLCNLKPRPIKGITSNGMLLCASDKSDGKVDPLTPNSGTTLGELVTFAGYVMKPVEAGNKASKVFGKICEEFYVNSEGLASFNGIPFMTSVGPIKCSLQGKIS